MGTERRTLRESRGSNRDSPHSHSQNESVEPLSSLGEVERVGRVVLDPGDEIRVFFGSFTRKGVRQHLDWDQPTSRIRLCELLSSEGVSWLGHLKLLDVDTVVVPRTLRHARGARRKGLPLLHGEVALPDRLGVLVVVPHDVVHPGGPLLVPGPAVLHVLAGPLVGCARCLGQEGVGNVEAHAGGSRLGIEVVRPSLRVPVARPCRHGQHFLILLLLLGRKGGRPHGLAVASIGEPRGPVVGHSGLPARVGCLVEPEMLRHGESPCKVLKF